jgi:hypothetical protein
MKVRRNIRSHSIHLLFLGAATILSGCHSAQVVPDQTELYPPADPDARPQRYATEAECIESVGTDYCEAVEILPLIDQTLVRTDSIAAPYYDDQENYESMWLSQSAIPQWGTYWVSRGTSRVWRGAVRGGFGHSALRFGGAFS